MTSPSLTIPVEVDDTSNDKPKDKITESIPKIDDKEGDNVSPTPIVKEEIIETAYYSIDERSGEILEYYNEDDEENIIAIARIKTYLKQSHTLDADTNALQKATRIAGFWTNYSDEEKQATKDLIEKSLDSKEQWSLTKVNVTEIIYNQNRDSMIAYVTVSFCINDNSYTKNYEMKWVKNENNWKLTL